MGARSTNPTQSFFDDFFRSGTDAVAPEPPPLINSPITATGGDSTLTITGYKVHIFTTTGPATLNVSSGGGEVEYLVVAGGGSGSAQYGGGGGAGGFRTNLSGHPRAGDPVNVQPGNTTVVVGAGGQYATPPAMPGVAGGNSSIDPNSPQRNALEGTGTITATGGGGGGAPGEQPNPWGTSTNGGPGGSGGGGAGRTGPNAPNYTGGAGNAGGYNPVEGYAGGDGQFPGDRCGGGGGGAGAVGEDAPSVRGGNGGVGVQCLIAGNPSPIGTPGPSGNGWFAGGGGGGGYNVDPGSGGAGGGANSGSIPSPAGGNGTANTGGGGGGGFHPGATTGGDGGSGIVVIRYPTS